jgi:hypothetical protein
MVGIERKYVNNSWMINIVDVGKEPNCQKLSTFIVQVLATILLDGISLELFFFSHFRLRCCIINCLNFLRIMFLDYCQRFVPFMKRMEFFFNIQSTIYGVKWKGDKSFQENDVTLLGDVVLATMHSTHFLVDWTNSIIMTL